MKVGTNSGRTLCFKVKRTDAADTVEFHVAAPAEMTVLEALLAAFHEHDPTLAFRYSCTIGRCYSCLVLLDGRAVVACREPMVDGATIAPMPNRTIIRDLATDDSSTRTYRE